MINDEEEEVRRELFDSLKNRYQNNLDERWWVCLGLCLFIVSFMS